MEGINTALFTSILRFLYTFLMNEKNERADFFQIRQDGSVVSIDLEKSLMQIVELVEKEGLSKKTKGKTIVLDKFYYDAEKEIFIGNIYRLRDRTLPNTGALGKELKPLDIPDDRGIAEECCFIIDAKRSLLIKESNKDALSANQLVKFFNKVLNLQKNTLSYLPILSKDGQKRLEDMKSYKKINLKINVASPEGFPVLQNERQDYGSALRTLSELSASNFSHLDITMSVGKGQTKRRLTYEYVHEMIANILKYNDVNEECVSKLEVVAGEEEEASHETIDVFAQRLQMPYAVKVNDDRSINGEDRIKQISKVFSENKELLDELGFSGA